MSGCANELFVGFLKETQKEARLRQNKQLVKTIQKAISSLERYPVPLTSGRDCLILDGFGEYLANKIDEMLRHYLRSNADVADQSLLKSPVAQRMRRSSLVNSPSTSPLLQQPVFAKSHKKDDTATKENHLASQLKRVRLAGEDVDDMPPPPPKRQRIEHPVLLPVPVANNNVMPSEKRAKGTEKEYLPKRYTGSWALLLVLYRAGQFENFVGHLTKKDLIAAGSRICDHSFEPQNGTFYSAWNSMKTLVSKDLVIQRGKPSRFTLTDSGNETAEKLFHDVFHSDPAFLGRYNSMPSPPLGENSTDNTHRPPKTTPSHQAFDHLNSLRDSSVVPNGDAKGPQRPKLPVEISDDDIRVEKSTHIPLIPSEDELASSASVPPPKLMFAWPPVTTVAERTASRELIIEVVLYVDNRERARQASICDKLIRKGLNCEAKTLELGDMIWIGRTDSGAEFVLDTILERKTVSDLCSSIIDGRYAEQKHRLKRCGAQNKLYLIEGYFTQGLQQRFSSLKETSVENAGISTVTESFLVQKTADLDESISYIIRLTRQIEKSYVHRPAHGLISFEAFQESNGKNSELTITEIFAQQLITLNQISGEKSKAIIDVYPTPADLMKSYRSKATEKDKMELLQDHRCGSNNRRLGPNISRSVYALYCNADYPTETQT